MFTYFIQFGIVASVLACASFYFVGIIRGKVQPVLATWLLFLFGTVLSILTNFAETGWDGLMANSFNLIDTFAVMFLFCVMLLRKNVRKTFTAFEKYCIGAVVLVFAGWIFSGENVVAHLAIQVIFTIAYLPTFAHMWQAKSNTESLPMWCFACLAPVFGLVEPLRSGAFLPLVYNLRTVISTFLVILLILRIKYRTK
ncbi:MAG: hypothetical protein AAB373_01060 [Patescibacteria group bacterium]